MSSSTKPLTSGSSFYTSSFFPSSSESNQKVIDVATEIIKISSSSGASSGSPLSSSPPSISRTSEVSVGVSTSSPRFEEEAPFDFFSNSEVSTSSSPSVTSEVSVSVSTSSSRLEEETPFDFFSNSEVSTSSSESTTSTPVPDRESVMKSFAEDWPELSASEPVGLIEEFNLSRFPQSFNFKFNVNTISAPSEFEDLLLKHLTEDNMFMTFSGADSWVLAARINGKIYYGEPDSDIYVKFLFTMTKLGWSSVHYNPSVASS